MDEPIQDRSLPEAPNAIRARLRVTGEWATAEQIFNTTKRKIYTQLRLPTGERKKSKKTGKFSPSWYMTQNALIEQAWFSWMAVLESYPPPADAVPCPSLLAEMQKAPHRGRKQRFPTMLSAAALARIDFLEPISFEAEVRWANDHQADPHVDQMTCPSRGAWSMLVQARENSQWFAEKMVKPLMLKQMSTASAETAKGPEISKYERMALDEIAEMIKEAVAASRLSVSA